MYSILKMYQIESVHLSEWKLHLSKIRNTDSIELGKKKKSRDSMIAFSRHLLSEKWDYGSVCILPLI